MLILLLVVVLLVVERGVHEAIHQALHRCGANRIGHGTRLEEDPDLMARIKAGTEPKIGQKG